MTRRLRRPSRVRTALAVLIVAAATVAAHAQFAPFGRIPRGLRMAKPEAFDGTFQFCRAWFRSSLTGDGGSWSVDYPRADINLSIRLSELTKTPVGRTPHGNPNHLVLRLTDDELFQCPFVMMTEVGSAFFDDREAARLREYLLKGGFLWVDDFWGTYAWHVWVEQIRKVFQGPDYPIVDLAPDHPLFRAQFAVERTPQIASIGWWLDTGSTSERGADSAEVHTRAILDEHGRVMVLMTHNTDVGDSWEREGDDPSYFYAFAADGYAFGINVVLYALTH